MFEGYGERATLSVTTPQKHNEYGMYSIERYDGAIPFKGQQISEELAPKIIRVLDKMLVKAHSARTNEMQI